MRGSVSLRVVLVSGAVGETEMGKERVKGALVREVYVALRWGVEEDMLVGFFLFLWVVVVVDEEEDCGV